MEDYQERIVVEKKELDEKINKLSNFLSGNIFINLALDKKNLLTHQWEIMQVYSTILGLRLAN